MKKEYLIAMAVITYMGGGYAIREQSIKLGVNACEKQTRRVNCQCIGNLQRQQLPVYSFLFNSVFQSREAEQERQQQLSTASKRYCIL